ncbi:MAG: shikimate dehydrogenase [Bacteroidia bacterium]|nr:shikimate dehydrogenase [Bacteroidia bacterium]
MKHYGLIGKTLSHSFSKSYFENKFRLLEIKYALYSNYELQNIDNVRSLSTEDSELCGLNVTIPYKETVLPFLDELSEDAKLIGAVNCIKIKDGKWIGYNADVYGFSQSIKPFLDNNHQKALILGTGGASKAVAYALKKLGVEIYFVTSGPKKTENSFLYSEINGYVMQAFKLIVNTTPLGTFPNVDQCPPLPYEHIGEQHLAFDLVYNPEKTLFLKNAETQGAIVVNGLSMLQLQAEKSWEIWNS